jgi:hypothetical protein
LTQTREEHIRLANLGWIHKVNKQWN